MTVMEQILGANLKKFLQDLSDVIIGAFFIIFFVAQSITVQGYSMEPTLHHNERLISEKITYRFVKPKRGDIVVIKDPVGQTSYWIKRIIATEGDTVQIKDGSVFLNGTRLTENYVAEPTFEPQGATFFVPDGHIFVMGDNRNNSSDSRLIGPIPNSEIMGRPILTYWPLNRLKIVSRPKIYR